MPRYFFTAMIAAVLLVTAAARAAEIEIPPPVTSKALPAKELSVHVNQPNCSRWTDECVNCTRGADGAAPTCSNIGFSCQPKAIRCIGLDTPQGEPQTK